jgi:hypothetical protein
MSESAAIWFFLSIAVICYTWHKIAVAAGARKNAIDNARDMQFMFNGKPVDGTLELTVGGKTSQFKLVDGKIQ